MSARLAWSLIAGSVLVTAAAAARQPDHSGPVAPVRKKSQKERAWLANEAANQLVTRDGGLGPLFADLTLGGPAPTPEQRSRIADFARLNDVEIYLDATSDELRDIRLSVTFGGCCGYEGADAFAARRLHRPRTAGDCSGEPPGWVDDWVADPADGTSVHARVRVNRVDVRWESSIAPAELLEKAEQLVGKPRGTSDRWIVLEPEHRFIYQVPIALMRDYPYTTGSIGTHREDLGLRVTTDHGRVSQVDFKLDAVDRDAFELMLKARWGAPKKLDAGLEFHANGHTITAFAEYENQVTIR